MFVSYFLITFSGYRKLTYPPFSLKSYHFYSYKLWNLNGYFQSHSNSCKYDCHQPPAKKRLQLPDRNHSRAANPLQPQATIDNRFLGHCRTLVKEWGDIQSSVTYIGRLADSELLGETIKRECRLQLSCLYQTIALDQAAASMGKDWHSSYLWTVLLRTKNSLINKDVFKCHLIFIMMHLFPPDENYILSKTFSSTTCMYSCSCWFLLKGGFKWLIERAWVIAIGLNWLGVVFSCFF